MERTRSGTMCCSTQRRNDTWLAQRVRDMHSDLHALSYAAASVRKSWRPSAERGCKDASVGRSVSEIRCDAQERGCKDAGVGRSVSEIRRDVQEREGDGDR